jgi:flagellar basal body rod protein FlgG
MLSGIQSGLGLMRDSQQRFDLAAANLANINNDAYQAQRMDGARVPNDPAEQMVDSMVSADSYKLGAAVVRTGDEMLGSLINIKA